MKKEKKERKRREKQIQIILPKGVDITDAQYCKILEAALNNPPVLGSGIKMSRTMVSRRNTETYSRTFNVPTELWERKNTYYEKVDRHQRNFFREYIFQAILKCSSQN